MSSDIKAAYRTTTGSFQNEAGTAAIERSRLKGVVVTGTGTVEFRDGPGGTLRLTLNIVTADNISIPDDGILFSTGIHGTLAGVTAVTIFYG
jgi:hypothetical protein